EATGVDTASGSPWRSVMVPRCAGISTTCTCRAWPWPCRKSLRSTCRSKARASISAAPARKIAVTNTLRHCRLSALSVGIFAHHDARLAHQGHVQFLSRHLLDAGVRRPGALLELQLSPFHGQRIALGLQLLQLHEGGAVAMA